MGRAHSTKRSQMVTPTYSHTHSDLKKGPKNTKLTLQSLIQIGGKSYRTATTIKQNIYRDWRTHQRVNPWPKPTETQALDFPRVKPSLPSFYFFFLFCAPLHIPRREINSTDGRLRLHFTKWHRPAVIKSCNTI